MKKIIPLFLIPGLISFFFLNGNAQSTGSDMKTARQLVDEEQKSFRDFLTVTSMSSNIKRTLQRFAINDVNGLQNNLQFLVTAPRDKRIKGIRSLSYFMKEMEEQLKEEKINELDIPEIVRTYKQTLSDLLSRRSVDIVDKNFKNLSWRNCQLLANAFWEFDEKKQMADLSAYKRVIETPEYIFSFLEGKPGFYYTDLLVNFMARNYPERLLSYLQKNNNSVTKSIRDQNDRYVQQLISFSSNSLASELAPFAEQIADNELSIEDILAKRKKVNDYYQLLVNTVMNNEQKKHEGEDPQFQPAVLNALAGKSLDFYVKKLNDMHSAPDAQRFQSVQTLRPQDLYYIIVTADEEMYTSTYLGLYKRLLTHFKEQSADSILNLVHNQKFREFMRIAGTYNTLTDFLKHMPSEKSRQLIHLFISDIEANDDDETVASAVDIADAFISLSGDPVFNNYVTEELDQALEKSRRTGRNQSIKLYTILHDVYDLVNSDPSSHTITANYKTMLFSSLKDKDGTVSELVLFYGDEDGKNSYNSFMSLFKDKASWDVKVTDSWVTIRSLKGQPVRIFANLPLNTEDEEDLAAQQALAQYLESQHIRPSVLIHRGHSYHLQHTLKYLNPSVKLAILGSCGGYKNMKKIMEMNPEVHIIASKQVGSMAVNDPLLGKLNSYLIEGKNIDWVKFWAELNENFKNEPMASRLFEEYIPPYKNLGSYVIRLYGYAG